MKTLQKINPFIAVVALATAMLFTSSCKKENSTPAENSAVVEDQSSGAKHNANSMVFPTNAHMFGKSYSEWSASWWKWSMESPLAGHPFIDSSAFNVSSMQSGHVWFLAAPFGTVVRNISIPHGKELFVGLLNAEASNLEGLGTTFADQHANAAFNADHIINLTASIDGISIDDLSSYRVASPQFSFTAPTPWIYGTTGGAATSSADGYYLMLKQLSHGDHVLHYTGAFHFAISAGDPFDFDASLDMTYNIHVQ